MSKKNRALSRTNPFAAELARHRTALGELAKAKKWLPQLLRQYKDDLSLDEADDLEEACIALGKRIQQQLEKARINYNRWNDKHGKANEAAKTESTGGAAG